VTKINPSGSALVYSTYLGGSINNYGYGIEVDSAGNAYVTGFSTSKDFPTTSGAFQTACDDASGPCWDAFVSKLDSTGSALLYSTYLGGSGEDEGLGIAVDSTGNAYVAGWTQSNDFPVTPGAFQTACGGNPGAGCENAFATKLNPAGSALVYSTYLGGSDSDYGTAIAVDASSDAYVTGYTSSLNFPTMNALQPTYGGGEYDAFVTEFNPTGSALVYSTYLGGGEADFGYGVAVDSGGSAYITGNTDSTDFPTMNALQPTYGGGENDAFVTEFNPTGSALVYSTYLGGSAADSGNGIAVDSAGNAYVTGYTYSKNFPVTPNALQKTCFHCTVGGDAFVSKLNPVGSAFAYSTFLGGDNLDEGNGIAVDSSRNAYLIGYTRSPDFPTMNPLQAAYAGNGDAFVAKLFIAVETATALTSAPNPSTHGQPVTFTAVVSSSDGTPPDGETVKFMKGPTLLGTGALSGGSASFTTSALSAGAHGIRAVYGGDSNFLASTSIVVKQVVDKEP